MDNETAPSNHGHWADLLHVAAFIATESLPNPPVGIRLTWKPAQAKPSLHQLGPLTLAIRCALLGNSYPESELIAGTVSPDFFLVNSSEKPSLQSVVNQAHQTIGDAAILQARYWPSAQPIPAEPKSEKPKSQPIPVAPPSESIRKALDQVLGQLVHGQPAKLPLPEDWAQLSAQAEGRFRSTQFKTLMEVFELGLLATGVRAGLRKATWAAERIPLFSKRLIREHRHQELEGWRLSWLTLLVSARVQGEESARTLMKTGPPSIPRKQSVQVPLAWLRRRATLGNDVAERMTQLWRRALGVRTDPPHSYPAHDLRNLTWSPAPDDPHSSPVANWMTAMERTALAWTQITILDGLKPTRPSTATQEAPWTFSNAKRASQLDKQAQEQNEWLHETQHRNGTSLPHTLQPKRRGNEDTIQRIEEAWRQIVLRRAWRALVQEAAHQEPK